MFQRDLAIELINICGGPANANAMNVSGLTLNGNRLVQEDVKLITAKDGMADTEGFVGASEMGDILVAFRDSDVGFLKADGSLKDWFTTNLASGRIPYQPDPGLWPNRRWVHRGFWHAYELARGQVTRKVQQLIDAHPARQRKIFVTGFSLGGAIALLAALDLGKTFNDVPVVFYSFAAPRVGDGGLNHLLAERVSESFIVGFRGDPVIHLPPLGPNFPLNFRSPVTVQIGPVTYDIATPFIPQIGQEYQTADKIIYIDRKGRAKDHLPLWQETLRFADHNMTRYHNAIAGLPATLPVSTSKTMPGARGRGASTEAALHMMHFTS